MKNFDVIVIGIGGMGSATAYHLAKRGANIIALEKFQLNHLNGSSHGRTRMIRSIYFEHLSYMPLIKRAYSLWRELQDESGNELLLQTGGLMIGPRDGKLVSNVIDNAEAYNLPYELLSKSEIAKRYGVLQLSDDYVGVFDPYAGILFPERCIEAHATLAQKAGADLHFNEPMTMWAVSNGKIIVKTERNEYMANSVIFTTGGWLTELVPDLHLPLESERQCMFWFRPIERNELFSPKRMPVLVWQKGAELFYYSFPDIGDGFKVARHHYGEITTPSRVREIDQQDELPVRAFLKENIPLADGQILSSATCHYTNTPDEHFIMDFHPKHRNVILISPCSGHGFKFSSVIGEIASELALDGKTSLDTSFFRLARIGVL
ncbi:MAG TPA: N-methyl-L-tryptophan oxidase [Candidatus Bathyarchaeia archaeon]|nr:N-methyl-L-tryptophan oxidase [Candidatus Bathyarchaeia archaeon]